MCVAWSVSEFARQELSRFEFYKLKDLLGDAVKRWRLCWKPCVRSATDMPARVRAFLDTNALFAGIWSVEGGARMILKLGEAGAIRLLVSSQVLSMLVPVVSIFPDVALPKQLAVPWGQS